MAINQTNSLSVAEPRRSVKQSFEAASQAEKVADSSDKPVKSFDQQLSDAMQNATQNQSDKPAEQQSHVDNNETQLIENVVLTETTELALPAETISQAENIVPEEGKDLPMMMAPVLEAEVDVDQNAHPQVSGKVAAAVNRLTTQSSIPLASSTTESILPQSDDASFADVLAEKSSQPTQMKSSTEDMITVKPETTEQGRLIKAPLLQTSAISSSAISQDAGLTKDQPVLTQTQQSISVAVGHKQWADMFTQRIAVMAGNGQQQVAELKLNPARLGTISVQLKLDEDKASVTFLTSTNVVKEAIEVNLHRLREQFESQGLQLGDVDVSSRESEQMSEQEYQQSGSTDSFQVEPEVGMQSIEIKTDIHENGLSVFV